MRAITHEESIKIAGGRHALGSSNSSMQPLLKKAPTEPGNITVIGYIYDAPPMGFSSWYEWDEMNTFYWESNDLGGDFGGGGGGTPHTQPVSYNDGIHNVYVTTATSKNGLNNPGDMMWTVGGFADKFKGATESSTTTSSGTLAQFPTEQEGIDALADLLDHNYAGQTMESIFTSSTHNYTSTDPETEANNVVTYMQAHGYTDTTTPVSQMSDAEFNTLLNAISKAEGNTNI